MQDGTGTQAAVDTSTTLGEQQGVAGGGDSSLQGFLKAVDPRTGNIRPDAKLPEVKTPDKTETGQEGVKKQGDDKAQAGAANQSSEPAKASTETGKPDWWDVVSKTDKAELSKRKKELAKLIDMDDFDIDFAEKRKAGVDPYKFLEAKTRDWTKMSDIDVMRWSLRQQYKDDGLSEEEFGVIEEDALGKYKLTAPKEPDENATVEEKQQYEAKKSEFEKQKRLREIQLKTEANKVRKTGAEEDAKFTIPDRKADEEAASKAEALEKEKQELIKAITEGEFTKKLRADKKFVIGEGEDAYNVPVDVDKLLEYAPHTGKFWTLFDEKNDKGEPTGKIDFDLLFATINYAMTRKDFEKGGINHGKSRGIKKESDELTGINKDQKTGEVKETLNDAFKKRGVDVPL